MKIKIAALMVIVSLSSGVVWAQTNQPRGLQYLPISDIAPFAMLPRPVEDGSQSQIAELAELQAIAKSRTEERLKLARFDDVTISAEIFESAVPGFEIAKLPLTAKLLDAVKRESNTVSHAAKVRFDRKRPYEFDPTLNVCSQHRGKNATYPSGHTTVGFAMASILARLIAGKSGPIMARAVTYGESRMMCGVHYRSDVTAGQAIGTAVALALLQNAQFKAEFNAAEAELRAAGLTP